MSIGAVDGVAGSAGVEAAETEPVDGAWAAEHVALRDALERGETTIEAVKRELITQQVEGLLGESATTEQISALCDEITSLLAEDPMLDELLHA